VTVAGIADPGLALKLYGETGIDDAGYNMWKRAGRRRALAIW